MFQVYPSHVHNVVMVVMLHIYVNGLKKTMCVRLIVVANVRRLMRTGDGGNGWCCEL